MADDNEPKKQKVVFLMVPGPDRKTYFNRAGSAFVNKDGSLNLKLDFFPQLVFNIRDPKPNGNGEDGGGQPPFRNQS